MFDVHVMCVMCVVHQTAWEDELIRSERDILNEVYDVMELKDGKPDMTKQEFEQFLKALPQKYTDAFEELGKTFEQLAGRDRKMDYNEFQDLVDSWVQQIAKKGGSYA